MGSTSDLLVAAAQEDLEDALLIRSAKGIRRDRGGVEELGCVEMEASIAHGHILVGSGSECAALPSHRPLFVTFSGRGDPRGAGSRKLARTVPATVSQCPMNGAVAISYAQPRREGKVIRMKQPLQIASEDPDRTTIVRILEGDTDAYGEIVARHEGPLRGLILGMVGDRELAEDVLQETFWVAYRALPRFRGDAKLSTWLYRIAVREASRWRVRWRRARRGQVSLGNRELEASPERSAVELREEREHLSSLLECLRPSERAALMLHVGEGRSYDEIAEILRTPPGTVASWIHRARQRLRQLSTRSSDGVDRSRSADSRLDRS